MECNNLEIVFGFQCGNEQCLCCCNWNTYYISRFAGRGAIYIETFAIITAGVRLNMHLHAATSTY